MEKYPNRANIRVELLFGETVRNVRGKGLTILLDKSDYPDVGFIRGMTVVVDWRKYIVTAVEFPMYPMYAPRKRTEIGLRVRELEEGEE